MNECVYVMCICMLFIHYLDKIFVKFMYVCMIV